MWSPLLVQAGPVWGLCQGVKLETPVDEACKRPESCNGRRLGTKSPTQFPQIKLQWSSVAPVWSEGRGRITMCLQEIPLEERGFPPQSQVSLRPPLVTLVHWAVLKCPRGP